MSQAAAMPPPRPIREAAIALAALGAFFYLSYGLANWLASRRTDVPSIVFDWEGVVPFLAWTILPYWTTNAFYAVSLFLCRTRDELATLVRRLATTQIVAVACFILFPLRFSFARPPADGFAGFMFDALASFDKPFNQAPSLHIALTIVLWVHYVRHLPRWGGALLGLWFSLVLVSVLTTYQHHFIDIPTGALLGWLAIWLWPDEGGSPLGAWNLSREPKRRRLALRYGLGALVLAALASLGGGLALLLLWPALACALVALAYLGLGPGAFQKDVDGRLSLAASWLFAPYLAAASLNAWLWTRRDRAAGLVADGVAIGPLPRRGEPGAGTLVDLCAELPAPAQGWRVHALPALDLVPVPPAIALEAADRIERARRRGPVRVSCALGYGRSATAVGIWLLHTGRAATPGDAVAMVRKARPRAVVGESELSAILAATAAPRP
ncbi:MAG: phosphatase PAP2/dual specificity phosphatase family protein [Alphaproteobacteria bacterium]|nr:phosphatase PAP2/dual specificity phosphatase family protein [Alphaproteobacteria bacterium]